MDSEFLRLAFFVAAVVLLLLPCLSETARGAEATGEDSVVTYSLTNQYVWELTHFAIDDPPEALVSEWIAAISQLLGVVIHCSQNVKATLVQRARHLRHKMMHIRGGRQRKKMLDNTWQFKVLKCDVRIVDDLLKENRELHAKSKEFQTRVASLECKVQTASQLVLKIQNGTEKSRGKRVSSTGDYSRRHETRLKRARKESCDVSLRWLEKEGYQPLSVEVLNSKGDTETIQLTQAELLDSPTTDESQLISMALYMKDKHSVSGKAYHEMARLFSQMPRHYKLKQKIRELNSLWDIAPMPNSIIGVQQKLLHRLKLRIEHLEKNTSIDAPFKVLKKVRVKLSGDGTNIGKRLKVENFTFTLLDEGDTAYSYEGCHPLAIFRAPEKYEYLKNALKDIIAEVESLKTITVGSNSYTIEYYLGGDWKFLALVTGIDSATSTYSCIWCKCPKQERYNPSKKWSLTDTSNGARSTEENVSQAGRTKRFNVSNPPLFPSIPLKNVVIDNLHLFLRVSDVLIDLLIVELKRQDALDKHRTFTSFDVSKYAHLKGYENFVTSCGVPDFQFYIGQASKQLKCRSLTGMEKLRVVRSIRIKELLPHVPDDKVLLIQQLWTNLIELNEVYSR